MKLRRILKKGNGNGNADFKDFGEIRFSAKSRLKYIALQRGFSEYFATKRNADFRDIGYVGHVCRAIARDLRTFWGFRGKRGFIKGGFMSS